ncbi:MAG: hypothetical protein IT336_05395 [Thermomicrobiales bacterium]|nr:hypothetical protein [Thermomicrobiales bacterium]
MAISTVQDADSGVVQILVTTSQNADTVVPPFIPATTDPIVVTSTKINQAEIAKVSFNVTNGDVFTSACSYEF